MTQPVASSPPISSPPAPTASLLHAGLAGSMGLLLLGVALWDFRLVQLNAFLRDSVLAAEIVTGLAAAICFGGSIHFINRALAPSQSPRLPWLFRFTLAASARVLLLLQVAAMAIALVSAGLALFGDESPPPEVIRPSRGWNPPSSRD